MAKKRRGLKKGQNIWYQLQERTYHGHFSRLEKNERKLLKRMRA